ncbi:antibiotic biosynthesis monooxygenase [Actinomycetospora termitidis]|uniref:Antibiotic biosynthesis monooxygenase n=1 Tax=Actinomycetospora termitidis TaxID=3053470 RepID=A0ABT7MEZ1_9PSEU|nr:antibiotic biosynthesis monooxygenase [Actinomycetospora sp. Odt1-22]MDL5159231.1 antibiotic biosynthesis monooxygenase [Actinomycetospora sp. Odt1-22]
MSVEPATDLVTVVVAHHVPPHDEADFLAWQHRMADAERRAPGHRGTELHPPVAGVQDDWVAVTRFASEDALETWLASAEREQLIRESEHFRDFRLQRVPASFGSWFPTTGAAGPVTPSWKTALSVLVGLYPTVVLLTLGLSALWPAAPLWASLLVGNVLSVGLLTWAVMPVVTRALGRWLEPTRDAPQPWTDVLGTVASLVFLAVAAGVFALLT